MTKKIFLLTMLLSLNTMSAGRINAPVSPIARCNNVGVPAEKCETIRQKEVASGCITQEEADTLRAYGAFPVCSELLGVGLNKLGSWCPCGCFAARTQISAVYQDDLDLMTRSEVLSSRISAAEVSENFKFINLMHFSFDTNLHEMSKDLSPIRIATFGKEKKDLIKISTFDGRNLYLTEKHPVLTINGVMKLAKNLRPTDKLVDMNGDELGIKELSQVPYNGLVYNFATEAKDKKEHVIFAEGVAVGDLYWQSSLEDEMNQIFIRQ